MIAVAIDEKLDIGEFTVHLRNIRLPMGLVVDDVRLAGTRLHLERTPFAATCPEPGTLEVFVSAASLAAFLERQAPAGLKKFQVEARDGKLFIQAVKAVIVELKASAVCHLEMVGGTQLMVILESVDMAGAGIKNLIQAQLDKINPIIDTADLPIPATIQSILIEQGGIILRGQISPP